MSQKVSFVIPSYNSACWVPHAVESALKQSYANIEVVVVDDGSTDSTQKVMEFMAKADSRIKYFRLEKNMGRSYARNFGNKQASGDYILVLDADDIAYPDRAKLSVEKLKHSDFVHGSCEMIDAIGNLCGVHNAVAFDGFKDKLNYMVHSTCGYRRELALAHPYKSGEPAKLGLDDWQFQREVVAAGARVSVIVEKIGAYRDIETGVSKTRDEAMVDAYKTAYLEALRVPA